MQLTYNNQYFWAYVVSLQGAKQCLTQEQKFHTFHNDKDSYTVKSLNCASNMVLLKVQKNVSSCQKSYIHIHYK
jgi:hypothetical protein